MDAKAFLDIVLPTQGRRCVGELNLQTKQFNNHKGADNAWAAKAAARVSEKGMEAYFGCASYRDGKGRTKDDVAWVRAFWVDIDTQENKPDEKYTSRQEARNALAGFSDKLSLERPLVVSSGYGIHGYWVLDEDITPGEWTRTAGLLKLALKEYGLAVDHARTSDVASVLRVPGTVNHKGGKTRTVKAIERGGHPSNHGDFRAKIESYLEETGGIPDIPLGRAGGGINSDLSGGEVFSASYAEKIADHCGVVGLMRDNGGSVSEPTWYGVLGVLNFTEEGKTVAHDWSSGYDGYSRTETDRKLAQVGRFAPTTCAKLSDCEPSICAVCPHKGKITSPISLGTAYGEPQLLQLPPAVAQVVGKTHLSYPRGFGWGNIHGRKEPCLWHLVEDVNDEGQPIQIQQHLCDVNLIPTARIRAMDGTHSMLLRGETPKGEVKEFIVETGTITRGDKSCIAELGKYEVTVPGSSRHAMEKYLSAWIDKLRDEYKHTSTTQQFGWQENDGFVWGEQEVTPAGLRPAIVVKGAKLRSPFLKTVGSFDVWKKTIDRLYNHDGEQPRQACVLGAFAAPLYSLLDDASGGVILFAYSAGSGFGKTTAQKAGMSAFGNAYNTMLLQGAFSDNALITYLGTMRHLPALIDEMTSAKPEFASQLVYQISAGKGKERLSADADPRETLNWSTVVMASANSRLSDKVSAVRANSQAELARIFEFSVTTTGFIGVNEAMKLIPCLDKNHGHAGQLYLEYLVNNRAKVVKLLDDVRAWFNNRAFIQQHERYWSQLHACLLVALLIGKKLGLFDFDFDKFLAWILEELALNRGTLAQAVQTPTELFADMLADLWGGVLVTKGMGNLANKVNCEVLSDPRGHTITGRSVVEDDITHDPAVLWISVQASKDWCNKHGASFREIHTALVREGWASPQLKRVSLGKGSDKYSGLTGPVKVLDINPDAVRDLIPPPDAAPPTP